MDFPTPYAVLGTVLVILIYLWTGFVVGKARKTYGVEHPNTHGPDAFNRVWRAHQNTLEALPQIIPALWMFALIISDHGAAILALIWALGRILYVRGYAAGAEKRSAGFLIAMLATAVGLFWPAGRMIQQLLL